MPYHYEATTDYLNSISEVDILVNLASKDDENREMFLKLSVVSMVTKFQVFVEKILEEFRYSINGIQSGKLPLYMRMNAVKLSVLDNSNSLLAIQKHGDFSKEKRAKIVNYLKSISFITDDKSEIQESFMFKTKFPLGKTGKKELVDLLSQIDGNPTPFNRFGKNDFGKLDSILQTRHCIIHQDRFAGTETTVRENIIFMRNLVEYIDSYLFQRFQQIKK